MAYPVAYRPSVLPTQLPPAWTPAPGGGFQIPPANDNFPIPANDNFPPPGPPEVRMPPGGPRIPWKQIVRRSNEVLVAIEIAIALYELWNIYNKPGGGWTIGGWDMTKQCRSQPPEGFLYFTVNHRQDGASEMPCLDGQIIIGEHVIPDNAKMIWTLVRQDSWGGIFGPWYNGQQWERDITGPSAQPGPEPDQVVVAPPLPRPVNPIDLPIGWPVQQPDAPPVTPGVPRPVVITQGWTPESSTSSYESPHPPPVTPRTQPKPGEKERKVRSNVPGLFQILRRMRDAAYATTEGLDMLDAFYEALPKQYQVAKPRPQDKAKMLYRHWEKVDLNQALLNLIQNHVEDALVGRLSRDAQREATRRGIILGPAF